MKPELTRVDSDLGPIVLTRQKEWKGKCETNGSLAPFSIPGDEAGPVADRRAQLLGFLRGFDLLQDEIAIELYRLYTEYVSDLDEIPGEFPRPQSVEESWAVFSIVNITPSGQDGMTMVFCFADSADDSTFGITVGVDSSIRGDYLGD